MKKNNNKGFTLAELLIIVAIIVVLVAVGIPILSIQLEKSREATDIANVRNAYAKVMVSVNSEDKEPHNANGVTYIHDRWYISVDLTQKQRGWQSGDDFMIGGISSKNQAQWVGDPKAEGTCLVSYTKDHGAIIAWQYNFAHIMNGVTIESGEYAGKTATQLFKENNFPMLESSGSAGEFVTSAVKHQLGLKDTDQFAYKMLPAPDVGSNCYMLYVSQTQSLRTGLAKNQTNVGTIAVTGYIYQIRGDGSSALIKEGTEQVLSTYTNSKGQEKIDVFGNQDKCTSITNYAENTPYSWDL